MRRRIRDYWPEDEPRVELGDDDFGPEPRDDPPEERSHRAARIADRNAGRELGDVDDDQEGDADEPHS